jgi:dTDP-4-amino-4,6-dideoxygalactose transaminase
VSGSVVKNGSAVAEFERELASYCGAKYAIGAANGTVTLQAALVALGVKPGDRVATTPLTMAATTIAILNVGAVPMFTDVDPATWTMAIEGRPCGAAQMPVSLYGLCVPHAAITDEQRRSYGSNHIVSSTIDDAAQTLRKHSGAAFTSLSFQSSKVLSLGEGGALLTNDETLAENARSYLSLGYKMTATQARIDPDALKSPTFERHHSYPSINGRMNDITAAAGLDLFNMAVGGVGWTRSWPDELVRLRREAAQLYRDAISGCDWLRPQHVPEGWTHDYWSWAVACNTPQRAVALQAKMGELGAEVPYGAWRLTYQEPALRHLAPHCFDCDRPGLCDVIRFGTEPCRRSLCPIAEDLQPRLLQFQTNRIDSAEKNAKALKRAIEELSA